MGRNPRDGRDSPASLALDQHSHFKARRLAGRDPRNLRLRTVDAPAEIGLRDAVVLQILCECHHGR